MPVNNKYEVTMKTNRMIITRCWLMPALFVFSVLLTLVACTKEGNIIYEWDPDEPKASTAPTVTVIYGKDALGDRSYNDLIYQGVEEAADKYGLRTIQLSPTSYEEGKAYLQSMFETVKNQSDTIRRLFIVPAAGYDDYIRQNCSVFDSNPYPRVRATGRCSVLRHGRCA